MSTILIIFAISLVVCLVLGLIRVAMGPTAEDSMLAMQIISTTGVGFLAIMAEVSNMPSLIDVALVLALLTALAAIAFVRTGSNPRASLDS